MRNLLATPINTVSVLLSWDEPVMPNGVVSYIVRVDGTLYSNVAGGNPAITVGGLGEQFYTQCMWKEEMSHGVTP